MQFEIGKPDYPLVHAGEITGARIAGEKRRDLPLLLVDVPTMAKLRDQNPVLRGIPTHVAFDRTLQTLWVYPSPAGEYVFEVDLGPEDVATFGRPPGTLNVSPRPVTVPPDTHDPQKAEYTGTITKPMLKRGR